MLLTKDPKMRYIIFNITLFFPLLTLLASESMLKDIKYSVKSNGIMLSFDYTHPIPDENIIGWKSDRNWLYLTLLGVKPPVTHTPKQKFNGHIKEIVIDDFDESVQIAILMEKSIQWYDIINSQGSSSSFIFIHTKLAKSKYSHLKENISQYGESVFSHITQEGFPVYNTDFESAFDKAREKLGPNALFKYKGKLYNTNHIGESTGELISGLKENEESFMDHLDQYASSDEDQKVNWDDKLSLPPPESLRVPEEQEDEYFINYETGEELVEWEEIPYQQNDSNIVKGLIAELNEHSSDKVELNDPMDQYQKLSWRQRIPLLIKIENSLFRNNTKSDHRYFIGDEAALIVHTNIDGVPIYIDGRYVGYTPLSPIRVEPGWHQVSVFSPQYLTYLNTDMISHQNNDLKINDAMINNKMFGKESVYVESGKIAKLEMRFDYLGPPLPEQKKRGGWIVGFPVIALFLQILWQAT